MNIRTNLTLLVRVSSCVLLRDRRVSGEVPVSLKESLAAKDAASSFLETRVAAPVGSVDELASASGEESRSSSKKTKVKLNLIRFEGVVIQLSSVESDSIGFDSV